MNTHSEASRQTPIVEDTDVIVCGAGPAGVAAAVAAARSGARVALIERQGCLGGVWTTGLLSYILEADQQHVFMAELLRRLAERDGAVPQMDCAPPPERPQWRAGILYSPESMKLVLEEMCADARIRVRLHTSVVAAARDETNRLAVVMTESKSGREAWRAHVFVDCTGDGDLAALAGCGFDLGRPGSGDVQPMSLMGLVTGLKPGDMAPFITAGSGNHYDGKEALLAELRRAGVEPSYSKPTLFHLKNELYAMMANHEYGCSGVDADHVTRATLRARREVFGFVSALRRLGGVWAGIELVATGAHIGVREARRIHGRYTVTRADIMAGVQHPDAVYRVLFPVDVHATNPELHKGYSSEGVDARPYDIPLRALVARDVEGLFLAGRCISGDFFAHASYRVTGCAVALGDAAGRAAAWCAQCGVLPRDANWTEIVSTTARLAVAGSAA